MQFLKVVRVFGSWIFSKLEILEFLEAGAFGGWSFRKLEFLEVEVFGSWCFLKVVRVFGSWIFWKLEFLKVGVFGGWSFWRLEFLEVGVFAQKSETNSIKAPNLQQFVFARSPGFV